MTIAWILTALGSAKRDRRVRRYLLVSMMVVVANGLSCLRIVQGADVDDEILASRPRVNAILQAAMEEMALINSGQVPLGEWSPGWRPYVTAQRPIALDDPSAALAERLVELTRRAKARELELTRTMHTEVYESGIALALLPERLVDADARAESLAGCARFRTFMQSYVARFTEVRELARADILALGLPQDSENRMVGGLMPNADADAALAQFVDGELQAIDAIEAVVQFIEGHANTVGIEDGQLIFSDPATQTEFETLLVRVGLVAP